MEASGPFPQMQRSTKSDRHCEERSAECLRNCGVSLIIVATKIIFRGRRQHVRIVTPQFSQLIRLGRRRDAVGPPRQLPAMGPNDKFDLVIKGGDVLDPSQSLRGKRDIGIRWGAIEAIENEIPAARASKTIDATGKLVTPGLIDLHSHVYPYGSAIGIPADELAQFQCTTTMVSAGDAGVNNLAALRRYIVAQSRTRIYAFVHIANNGLSAFPVAELYNIDNAQMEACAMALAENPDFLLGVKVRMSENVIYKHGLEPLKRGIQACELAGWPAKMMVHIGGVETKELMSRHPQSAAARRRADPRLFRFPEQRRRIHQYRAGRQAVAGGARRQAARRDLRRRPWRRQFRLHRGGGGDPRRLHAGYDLLRHPRVLRQLAGHALSAERDEQVHAARLFAGAGGGDGDHRRRQRSSTRRRRSARCRSARPATSRSWNWWKGRCPSSTPATTSATARCC